jgi:hypothetical protein
MKCEITNLAYADDGRIIINYVQDGRVYPIFRSQAELLADLRGSGYKYDTIEQINFDEFRGGNMIANLTAHEANKEYTLGADHRLVTFGLNQDAKRNVELRRDGKPFVLKPGEKAKATDSRVSNEDGWHLESGFVNIQKNGRTSAINSLIGDATKEERMELAASLLS